MKITEGETHEGFDIVDLDRTDMKIARERGLTIFADRALPSDKDGGVLIFPRSSFSEAFEKAIVGALTQKNRSDGQKR